MPKLKNFDQALKSPLSLGSAILIEQIRKIFSWGLKRQIKTFFIYITHSQEEKLELFMKEVKASISSSFIRFSKGVDCRDK